MKRLVTVLVVLTLGMTLMAEEIDYEKYYKPYEVREAEIQKVLEAFNKTENPDDNCEAMQLFNRILKITAPQTGKLGMFRTRLYVNLCNKYLPQQKLGSIRRRYIVNLIIEGFTNDNDSYIKAGMSKWLIPNMEPEDLDEHARAIFSKILKERNAYKTSIFLFAKLGMDKELSETPIDYKTFKEQGFIASMDWGLLLFKARNGDKESIEKVLNIIENYNNEISKVTKLFLDLGFVPQPEIVQYLKKYLDSDKRLNNCEGAKGQLYATFAAFALNKILKGFPQDSSIYDDNDYIITARKWMKNQENLYFNSNPIPYYKGYNN